MTHREKMKMKAERRERWYQEARKIPLPPGFTPAWLNRRTRQPHEHRREIARNLSRG